MIDKLKSLQEKYNDLHKQLADPNILNDFENYQKIAKEVKQLEPIIEKYEQYKKIISDIEQAKEMLKENDEELREMAKEEIETKSKLIEKYEQELKIMLLPKDPNDDKNTIIEIRAGTGGDEAALFVADLYRMYIHYAENRRWNVETISLSPIGIGGFKEVIFIVSGENVYSRLKYESGIHRVQRVPETEANGRIHTSAVTVAVLPEVEEIGNIEIKDEDLEIDVYRSSGAGGQHVNKTESAVRITHKPTGIVVTCQDERSQIKNREKAMKILKAKLYEITLREQEEKIASERKSQVGTGDRSGKIRTYNFPQSRVTDHRIGLTLYKLNEVLNGDLDDFIDALITNDQIEKLKAV